LPDVQGRNDLITRDFFNLDDVQAFLKKEKNSIESYEVNNVSKDSREVLINITNKLKLEAIELGENPHAFINGKLLSVGDKLPLRSGVNTYDCVVARIEEDLVLIRCVEGEITLRLMPMVEVTN
jgi:hypothetical protein